MDEPRAGTVGFVVAGGESRRMGRDKALLPWRGVTLLDHAIQRLSEVCPSVRILCGPSRRYADRGLPVDVDLMPGTGPLGGLLTALAPLDRSALAVFLAVDLPFVTPDMLRRLVDAAPGWDASVPVGPAGAEPLCAVYRASCVEAVRQRLQAGDLKMTSFWPHVRVRQVPPEALADLGPAADPFRNFNEPSDFGPGS